MLKKTDWETLWVNMAMFAPGLCDCFYDNLRLEYLGDGDVRNPDGVETRLVDYGGISGVQYWGDVVNAPQS